jgi:hypothetical protein
MTIQTVDKTREKRIRVATTERLLIVAIVLLSLLVLCYAMHRRFDHDEFEHIHSAWYVSEGYVPYSDFFQNHHPLLWYSIAPVLLILGYSTQTVVQIRLVMLGLTLGIAVMTYLIARAVTSSTRASLLSVLLLLSMVMFVEKTIEIRPDVPQVLLGMISVYFFVRFIQTRETRQAVGAGLAAGFSFLFLQKTLFLLVAYAALLCYELWRRRVSIKSVLGCATAFSTPVLLFLCYLVASGSFREYVLTNWLVNMYWLEPVSPLRYPSRSFASQNALFWLLIPVAVGFILVDRKTDRASKALAFIGVVLLSSVCLVRAPYRQYFMFAIPLLCISVAQFLAYAFDRLSFGRVHIVAALVLLLAQPLSYLAHNSADSAFRDRQLAKVDLVIRGSTESDLIYDGKINFNLYRADLHYFWLSVGENKGLDTYNMITNGKYGDYDICQLVRSKQPRFISDFELDVAECGVAPFYTATEFPSLYVRSEQQGTQHLLWRNVGDSVALIGYNVEEVARQDGDYLRVTLWWQSLAEMDRDYTTFLHLVSSDGSIQAQVDTVLRQGERPTSTWKAGEIVEQESWLTWPGGAPSGDYTLKTGLYYWENRERVPVWDESGQRLADDTILLLPGPDSWDAR